MGSNTSTTVNIPQFTSASESQRPCTQANYDDQIKRYKNWSQKRLEGREALCSVYRHQLYRYGNSSPWFVRAYPSRKKGTQNNLGGRTASVVNRTDCLVLISTQFSGLRSIGSEEPR